VTGEAIALGNLKKKYYYPQIETYHYRCANNLIYGKALLT
jgi:hypothetical protein